MTNRCSSCGAPVDAADGFCEACGSQVAAAAVSSGADGSVPRCPDCSADSTARPAQISAEGYCENCGRKVPTARDHVELDVGLVAGCAGLSDGDLRQADVRLGRLSLDDNDPRRHQLTVEILRAALDWVSDGTPAPQRAQTAAERILGCEPNERALRFGLERGYRALATLLPERRIELVDMANSIRPRTWI